jgi:hypothetical protein
MMDHPSQKHTNHTYQHAEGCGHKTTDLIDYIYDGHLHHPYGDVMEK